MMSHWSGDPYWAEEWKKHKDWPEAQRMLVMAQRHAVLEEAEEERVELPRAEAPTLFKSACRTNGSSSMVAGEGFEPPTFGV